MQKKTRRSLFLLISAFIIGMPVYLFSKSSNIQNAESTAESAADTQSFSSSSQTNSSHQVNTTVKPTLTTLKTNTSPERHNNIENSSPIQRIQAIQNKSELHKAILSDHEKFSRYAEYNHAFSAPEKDPVVKRYEVEERTTQDKEDGSSLTIWSDKKYYLADDTATVYASLRNTEGQTIPTTFIGQLIFNEKVNLQTFTLNDHDQDGVYESTLPLSQAEGTIEAGLYKVLIVNNKNKLTDALTFILSEPEIQLSGNFKDSLTPQNELLIQAEVIVSKKQRFYFQASLYSANQIAIGSSQQALELSPGKHWVALPFDGNMIKDSGESGPFLLKNISLAKVTVPMQRAPLDKTEYFTQDYALNQFISSNIQQDHHFQAAK